MTSTIEGVIPNIWHERLQMWLVVKTCRIETGKKLPEPQRMSNGALIYALPGGGDWVGP